MGCIHFHSPFLPTLSNLKIKQSKTSELLWLPNREPTQLLRRQNLPSLLPLRTQALATSSLVSGLNSSPAASGDISVFIIISALLLSVYWVANFIVPDIITKYLQSKNTSEEQVPTDKNP